MPITVAAILAHPDDAEFLCAGTLIRLRREHGATLHVATMTPGDCGSATEPPEVIAPRRRAEGAAAAKLLGATYECLEERDLRVVYGEAALEKVVRYLNRVRPDVVFTHAPDDYHLDHEQTSKLVRAATFAAPIPNFLPLGKGELHPPLVRIPTLYYCDPLEGKNLFGERVEPRLRVDISGVIDEKGAALGCHDSQRAWLQSHHGVDELVESMRAWGREQGAAAGMAFAEGFRQHLGHSYPQADLLGALLGGR